MVLQGNKTTFKVLLVDDDPTIRMIGRAAFEKSGMIVEEAENGTQALELFDQDPADIVLLDIIMPEMDGFETCKALRTHEQGRSIPIFMVTSVSETESIEKAYELGATDFIIKPVNWTIVIRRILLLLLADLPQVSEVQETNKRILEQSHRSNTLRTIYKDELPEETKVWLQYIHDLDQVVGEVAVFSMIKHFITDSSKIVSWLTTANVETEVEEIQTKAQLLESKCSVINAQTLQNLSLSLQHFCSKKNTEAMRETIETIQNKHAEVIEILTSEFTYGTQKNKLMY